MSVEKEEGKLSILMFPWLDHGHIFSFLELAKRIISFKPKELISIYLCSTGINLDSIKPCISKHESHSIKLVELVLRSSQLPPELHTTKNLPSHLFPTLLQDFEKSSSSFIDILDSLKPHLLIYDVFQPWAAKYALSRGIPRVNFVTSGAAATSFYHHQHTHGGADYPYKGIYLRDEENVDHMSLAAEIIKDVGEGFAMGNFELSTDIVVLKSSSVLEGKYIDYLYFLCNKQIVRTGPLLADANNNNNPKNELEPELEEWLNGRKEHSVIYVSFGSECYLSEEQMDEVTKGLELCTANFVWIIRFPVEKELPRGFSERVRGRGLVVRNYCLLGSELHLKPLEASPNMDSFKWASQTSILAHSSVGGFVSHCGWSSTMESAYFGVPVVGMPMTADQPINARMMVEAGVGLEVVNNGGGGVYKGEEIAKAIDKVLGDKPMRERARYLSDKIKGKNEKRDLDQAVNQLMRLCYNKRLQQQRDSNKLISY